MNLRPILGGLKSYLPVRLASYKGTGGTTSGDYCYAVWLRHLSIIDRFVHPFRPRVVVELGPGDSIGLGLAALLSGAQRYQGLDVLEHASVETNEKVLDDLVRLFRERAPIPDDQMFPLLHPRLPAHAYPANLVEEEGRDERLSDGAVAHLRSAIKAGGKDGVRMFYSCPWSAQSVAPQSADLVISQVALQDMDHLPHRDDLARNLEAMAGWLKPGGVMSHQIDFSCPGGAPWNHHWGYGAFAWKLVRGKRPYHVNRVPLSEYLRLIEAVGCEVVGVEPAHAGGLPRERLAPPFRDLPDDDLKTRDALIVAVKR